ncbi:MULTISPECIES: hypothetical protein [Roseinatronobacter]|uniref:Uncharacterized protein n=1 Tax=Roseinatronobacter domitianus TaxID=2940293 RepID=A0ABT0LYT0_9RHOB|nr:MULTISPECIES: hypothetical protein [Roseibaca]MCL1627756.1 hypothetical protein [Roseibaca domitiana]
MPVPLAPIAATAARYGAIALAGYVLARQMERGRVDQRAEDAFDDLPEGLTGQHARDRQQWNMAGRFRRVVRLGQSGPGVEIDGSLLGRIRFRRV